MQLRLVFSLIMEYYEIGEQIIMKKNGFTLAEILISLGIIGVVAALTTPALIQDVSNAKVGPTLAKFKSSMENANRAIMQERGAIDLLAAVPLGNNANNRYDDYINELSGRLAGSMALIANVNNVTYSAEGVANPGVKDFDGGNHTIGQANFLDGVSKLRFMHCLISFVNSNGAPGSIGAMGNNSPSGFRGPYAAVYVDIDGENSGQNSIGFDIFGFIIDRNGGLIPMGSIAYATYANGTYDKNAHWRDGNCDDTNVTNGLLCTGSIFENNQRIIYK